MATKKSRNSTAVNRKTSKKKQIKSFRIAQSDVPFMTMRPSVQTLYWVILGVVVVIFTVWILKLQSDIQAVYDTIDANERLITEEVDKKDTKTKE